MADRYYRVAVGGDLGEDVVKSGSATPAAFVDVRVTIDATGATKEAAVKALNAAVMYILMDGWPPA